MGSHLGAFVPGGGNLGYAIELPRQKSHILGGPKRPSYCKANWKRWGAKPPNFSNGFDGGRGPFRLNKSAISGPEALLRNLK